MHSERWTSEWIRWVERALSHQHHVNNDLHRRLYVQQKTLDRYEDLLRQTKLYFKIGLLLLLTSLNFGKEFALEILKAMVQKGLG